MNADRSTPARPTIAALATPPGGGRRAVVRLSGARAKELAAALLSTPCDSRAFEGRGVADRRVLDGRGGQPARVVWASAPRSYTGEDVVELHVPGSPPLVRALLARILDLGARPAEPGEFTRRAFENGKLTLDQAQAVLGLVEARSEEAARAARALLGGASGAEEARVRQSLLDLVALAVASLDFAEDETGHVPNAELARGAGEVLAALERLAPGLARRPIERGEARAVLAGAPNAGKSSLFNRLAGARALVGPQAGTTRDPLRAELVGERIAVELVDTPGLEPGPPEALGEVGAAAAEEGRLARRGAAVIVWVVDATRDDPDAWPAERAALGADAPVVLAWNKIDRADAREPPRGAELDALGVRSAHAVSARTGAGVQALAAEVVARASAAESGLARELVERRRASLFRASGELGLALATLASPAPLELAVEHLREALDALDDLAGRTTPDELLDRVFARFCIGK